jgi:hypothetical protein
LFSLFSVTLFHCFSYRESRSGDGYGEMVQRDQGLWLYRAGQRRQGRVPPHLSCGKAGLSNLREGAKISYEEVPNKGKTSAENLRMV